MYMLPFDTKYSIADTMVVNPNFQESLNSTHSSSLKDPCGIWSKAGLTIFFNFLYFYFRTRFLSCSKIFCLRPFSFYFEAYTTFQNTLSKYDVQICWIWVRNTSNRSRVLLPPWSRSRLKKTRSCLEKKSGTGAPKKLAGSSALLVDKKHKEIVLLLLFFR